MRQTYDETGGPAIGRANLPLIREQMKAQKIDAFFVPHEDAYQNEYLPDGADRLGWATGFTGSAGAAFLFHKSSIVFVDGRYTLQAAQQLDKRLFQVADLSEPGPFGWLEKQEFKNALIGYDPNLVSMRALKKLEKAAFSAGGSLIAVKTNPIDDAWVDQPAEPLTKTVPQELAFTGEPHDEKRSRIAKNISQLGADALLVPSPASIAWLFNVRGGDVKCTPLPLGRAILHADGTAELFLRPEKVADSLLDHLGSRVSVRPINELERRLRKLSNRKVLVDPDITTAWFANVFTDANVTMVEALDPIALPRARKNPVEVKGAHNAHARDGVAMIKFLRWLESNEVQAGKVGEIEAAQKLESLRSESGELKDISFESIAGAGPNGAIVHYRVNETTERKLENGSLFLIDSGGQYLDGTTDITRTIAIGAPSEEHCTRYTLVLKGHIALARVKFPAGTPGSALDTLARAALWEHGLDYEHGTGHGVGSYLGVHEGPQRISKVANKVALEPGMILSNEPGYYKSGEYGIRIENLQVVTGPHDIAGGDKPMLGFEPLTVAPLERKLIVTDMLSETERDWINAYHARVLKALADKLTASDHEWLIAACAPL